MANNMCELTVGVHVDGGLVDRHQSQLVYLGIEPRRNLDMNDDLNVYEGSLSLTSVRF